MSRFDRASLLLLALGLAGCAGTNHVSSAAHPGHAMGHAGPTAPPASARMICDDDIRSKVKQALHLPGLPRTHDTWAESVYTCTYHLPQGRMTLSVHVLADAESAQSTLAAARSRAGDAQTLAGLGENAYGTPTGTAVVLKDDQILTVDATGLPAEFGPDGQKRADLAYEVASDVLGCWTGDE